LAVWQRLRSQHQQQQDDQQQLGAGRFADTSGEGARRREVRELAIQCGLVGHLGDPIPDQWIDPSGVTQSAVFRDLRDSAHQDAWDTLDMGRMFTALGWFKDFLVASNRVPFVPMAYAGDLRAGAYNHETLESFAKFVRRSGSRKAGSGGKALASDTISGYVSAIASMRTIEAHYVVTLQAANVRYPRALKRMRQMQPAGGFTRGLSRGLRAAQLLEVFMSHRVLDITSLRGAIESGAAIIAHNILLRGGELCCVEGRPFDAGRDFTFDAIEFRAPCAESRWEHWLTIDIVPVKDTVARARICPMPVRQRGGGTYTETGAVRANSVYDVMCPFSAVKRVWRARLGTNPPTRGRIPAGHSAAKQPFFVSPSGAPWDTTDTRDLARRFAVDLGIPPLEVGAKAFRIGGATDLQALMGTEAGAKVIKQRGRWSSDVAQVYQRALAEVHLDASSGVGDVRGRELEALIEGWAQPAQFR
jgi:hypothetical protein